MNFCKEMDKLPKLMKIILALPIIDIIWNIYRLVKSIEKNNLVGIILAIVCVFLFFPVIWILDIITIVLQNKVIWID